MKAAELREKSVDDLKALNAELRKEHFNLRMQKGMGKLEQPHLVRAVKRNVAQVQTILTEKLNQEEN